MTQAEEASQTQDWNPLEMLTLVQVPLELELVLKLWAQVTVALVGFVQGSLQGYGPLHTGLWAYPELEWDGPLSPACCPLLLVLG